MIQIMTKYSSKLYSPESILLAAQDLKEYGSILLEEAGDDIAVEYTLDDSKLSKEEFLFKFSSALADYQIKTVISEKTSFIKQMIIAQAFAPCDNLTEIVDVYEKNEKQ